MWAPYELGARTRPSPRLQIFPVTPVNVGNMFSSRFLWLSVMQVCWSDHVTQNVGRNIQKYRSTLSVNCPRASLILPAEKYHRKLAKHEWFTQESAGLSRWWMKQNLITNKSYVFTSNFTEQFYQISLCSICHKFCTHCVLLCCGYAGSSYWNHEHLLTSKQFLHYCPILKRNHRPQPSFYDKMAIYLLQITSLTLR